MKAITVDEITVEVRKTTIRSRMHSTSLNANSILLAEEIASEISMGELAVAAALADFVTMSPRVKVVKGNLDFEFPAHNVSPEKFKTEFYGYLDSDYATLIDQIVITLNEFDRVQNLNLAPGQIPDKDEKKR